MAGGRSYPRFATLKPAENSQLAVGTYSKASQGSSSHPLAFIAIITAGASVDVKVERLTFGVFGWLWACFWRSKVDVFLPDQSTTHSADSCSYGASVGSFLSRSGSACRENRIHFRLLSWVGAVWPQNQATVVGW